MKKPIVTFLLSFVIVFFGSFAVAELAISPLYREDFGAAMRAPEDMGGFAPMTAGFVVLAVALTFLAVLAPRRDSGGSHALAFGLFAWAFVVAEYCILPGWASLPVGPTVASGALSGVPVAAAAAAARWYASR